MNLNLACGDRVWPGFENSDINGYPGTSHVDLEQFPYPYEDGSVELVMMSHALFMTRNGQPVHPDLNPIMGECHRILRHGGWLRIDDNQLRCYQEGEQVDPGEIQNEGARGYPDHLRITREQLRQTLRDAGFSRVEDVPPGATLTAATGETLEAILCNSAGHHSFTVEAQK